MPALDDVIRIEIHQRIFGEVVKNVYHYLVTTADATDTPQELFDAWENNLKLALEAIQSDDLTYELAVIENLDDDTFFAEIPMTGAGSLVSPGMPSYVAYGIKLSRSTKVTRNGSKRIGGVTESTVIDNGHDLTSILTDAVTDGIIANLDPTAEPGLVGVYVPIIFRPANSVPTSPAQETNVISAASFNNNVTTQNSRKAGVGE